MTKQIQIHTFGCKVNTYDTGLLQKNLQDSQYSGDSLNDDQSKKIHVLNTCAVTQEATKQALSLVRRIRLQDPLSTIVVTGCGAQVDTESFSSLTEVDLVIANSHKGQLAQILDGYFKGDLTDRVLKSNIFHKDDLEMGGGLDSDHTRSFLKIQDGCNSFCSFCIIPYARGKSRSIPIGELVKRVQDLAEGGSQEVVLTGVHIGDYSDESLGSTFGLDDLIENVLKKTTIPRIRLTSLEPIEISDRLYELFQDERMCCHFHLSIQSAQSEVLKEMKRKYGAQEIRHTLEKIATRLPGAFVGMDVIAGFPTESEIQFEESYQLLSELPWSRLHVFPYSERSGTRAATIKPGVAQSERKKRAAFLRNLSSFRYQKEIKKQLGTVKKVLMYQKKSKACDGLSRDFWGISVGGEMSEELKGQEVDVLVTGLQHFDFQRMEAGLIGQIIKSPELPVRSL